MAEGDGTSRNFRSSYYEKLGFCGNEEKNILDLLIASSPFDIEKLSDLPERFDLDRRCIEAWKSLLGVDSNRKNPFDDFANVKQVRTEHYESLKHHIEVFLRHNLVTKDRLRNSSALDSKSSDDSKHSHEKSNNPILRSLLNSSTLEDENINERQSNLAQVCNDAGIDHTLENLNISHEHNRKKPVSIEKILEDIEGHPDALLTLMYLLEVGRLDSADIGTQLESAYCRKLSAIASFFVNVTNDLQEAFFLFRNFAKKLDENETPVLSQMGRNKI